MLVCVGVCVCVLKNRMYGTLKATNLMTYRLITSAQQGIQRRSEHIQSLSRVQEII